jgi:Cache 3/Cache 2 fusion domain
MSALIVQNGEQIAHYSRGDTHMHRNTFIACLLTLTCFIILIPSLGTAQSDKVKTSMAALKAETAKLGAPKVQGSDLYFGKTKASTDVVDAVVKKEGGAATLFVKSGDQYVRVATTVKKEDGTSAVGIALDAASPAIAKLNKGEAYYGDATIFGKAYDAGYEPIKDASGVIGAYYVGYPK